MPRARLLIAAVLAWFVGVPQHRCVRAAEPEVEATSPTYMPSIPATFLESSLPYDPAAMPRSAQRPVGPPIPPSSLDIDATITSQLLEGRNRTHHISNLPPEEFLASMQAAMPASPPPQSLGPQPTPSDIVAAQLQAAPPSNGHYSPTLPFDDNSAFPLYHPGLAPPRYPGEQVQFQQPMPSMSGIPQAYGPGAPGLFQQHRAELIAQRGESVRAAWVASAEAVFLTDSSRVYGPALVQTVANPTTLLTSSQVPDAWGMGPRLTLTRNRSENVSWDVGYLGIYNWDREAQVFSTNNLQLAGPIALASVDFFAADAMSVLYRTNIHSIESNLILTPDWIVPVGSFVIGSRYIYWQEKFDIAATDFDSGTSDYIVKATNRMYGGQIGWNGNIDSPIGGELTLKLRGGIFMTNAAQKQTIYDFDNTFELRNQGSSTDRTSYLGETSIVQSYNPMRGLDVRFGYTLMWINGLARAPDQVDMTDTFNSGQAVLASGHAFLHGFNLTVAYGW